MAVDLWMVALVSNGVLVAVYGWLAAIMLYGLRAGAWRTNLIGAATAAIFATCTVGHGVHFLHLALPFVGVSGAGEEAARIAFSDWRLAAWDGFTALVAIWYFSVRSRLRLFFEGAALCADLEERQRRAQRLHDDVVQGLARAKIALDLGHREEGRIAVAQTLESARGIISGLLARDEVKPGDLRRSAPGGH